MELPRPPGLYFVFKTSHTVHETQEPNWAHSSCTHSQEREISESGINESLPLLLLLNISQCLQLHLQN